MEIFINSWYIQFGHIQLKLHLLMQGINRENINISFPIGSSSRRSDRAAGRLDLRWPGQPDSGRVAVGVRSQDAKVRLHPEGVCAAARHDQPVTQTCRRRRAPPQWTKGVSSVILQHGGPDDPFPSPTLSLSCSLAARLCQRVEKWNVQSNF